MSSTPTSPSGGESPRHGSLALRDRTNELPDSATKRKRATTNGTGHARSRRRTQEPGSLENDDNDDPDKTGYNPDQPIEQRRELQRGFRDLMKELTEHGDEYLQAESMGLHDTVRRANQLQSGVQQTTEATIDARLLVNTVNASYRKTVKLTSGNVAQGLDVDEFVSKCITYMRLGAGIQDDDAPELTSTQHQRRQPGRGARQSAVNDQQGSDDFDEIGDEGDTFNWEHMGRFAALPSIRRPAVSGYLLGPLSVEKKVRRVAKRSAPFRPGNLRETRPEVLDHEDVQRTEKNDLTAICSKILHRLRTHQEEAQDRVEDAYSNDREKEGERLMEELGLCSNGGIDLLKFVINPLSFGQTVENLFYVSFLIRDSRVKVEFDDNGLPNIAPLDPNEEAEQQSGKKRQGSQKFQAIFNIDMQTWRDIIDAFEITEPVIEHRKEESHQGPGARGWYS